MSKKNTPFKINNNHIIINNKNKIHLSKITKIYKISASKKLKNNITKIKYKINSNIIKFFDNYFIMMNFNKCRIIFYNKISYLT